MSPIINVIKTNKNTVSAYLGRRLKFLLIYNYVYRHFRCSHSFIWCSLRFSVSEEHFRGPSMSVFVSACHVFHPFSQELDKSQNFLRSGANPGVPPPTNFRPRSLPLGFPHLLETPGLLPSRFGKRGTAPEGLGHPGGYVISGDYAPSGHP